MGQPVPRGRRHFLFRVMAPTTLLGLSLASAIYLVNSSAFWAFLGWLPQSFSEGLVRSLTWLLSPIQPAEVNAQAAQLEFATAWLFSGIAVLVLYLSSRAFKAILGARTRNAP